MVDEYVVVAVVVVVIDGVVVVSVVVLMALKQPGCWPYITNTLKPLLCGAHRQGGVKWAQCPLDMEVGGGGSGKLFKFSN